MNQTLIVQKYIAAQKLGNPEWVFNKKDLKHIGRALHDKFTKKEIEEYLMESGEEIHEYWNSEQ